MSTVRSTARWAAVEPETLSSHEIESMMNVGPETSTLTQRMEVAADWCSADVKHHLTPTSIQQMTRWIGLSKPDQAKRQCRLLSRMRANEHAWEFALQVLLPQYKRDIYKAATVAGSISGVERLLHDTRLGPPSAAAAVLRLNQTERVLFTQMVDGFSGTVSELCQLVQSITS